MNNIPDCVYNYLCIYMNNEYLGRENLHFIEYGKYIRDIVKLITLKM